MGGVCLFVHTHTKPTKRNDAKGDSMHALTLEEEVDAGEGEGQEGLDAQEVGELHHLLCIFFFKGGERVRLARVGVYGWVDGGGQTKAGRAGQADAQTDLHNKAPPTNHNLATTRTKATNLPHPPHPPTRPHSSLPTNPTNATNRPTNRTPPPYPPTHNPTRHSLFVAPGLSPYSRVCR